MISKTLTIFKTVALSVGLTSWYWYSDNYDGSRNKYLFAAYMVDKIDGIYVRNFCILIGPMKLSLGVRLRSKEIPYGT